MAWGKAFGVVVALAALRAFAEEVSLDAAAQKGGVALISLPRASLTPSPSSCPLVSVELVCRANPSATFMRTPRMATEIAVTPHSGGGENHLAAAD